MSLNVPFTTYSIIVHATALLYAVYTIVVFNLPIFYPIDVTNFNYSPIGVGVVALVFTSWWFFDARHWFKGPRIMSHEDD